MYIILDILNMDLCGNVCQGGAVIFPINKINIRYMNIYNYY